VACYANQLLLDDEQESLANGR